VSDANTQIPKDGLKGLVENWRYDFRAGLIVFLIALPLCLGIAIASGFPPIAGITTAIIGGIVVGPFMGSRLSIKGPAAGLISIAIASVLELGNGDLWLGYRYTLAVIVISGIIQFVFALSRLGRFVDFFPTSAVHGMLAAIGIIIISKQIPILLGVIPDKQSPLGLLIETPSMLAETNPVIGLIGFSSLAILFLWPLLPFRWAKKIPSPILVLLVAVPMGLYFDIGTTQSYEFLKESFKLGEEFLVSVPGNIVDGIVFPDFGSLFTLTSLKYIMMFSLVGSLESLLTVRAIDGLDPYLRKSDKNRDLLVLGAGNTISGFLGGLPMIAEVVRSSANVDNGARTRWSNFYHGVLLLLAVGLFPNFIHQIPLAALAALLIHTGFRLASPKLFKKTLSIGKEQLGIFLITIFFTLVQDLLVGIAAGICAKIVIHLINGLRPKDFFTSDFRVQKSGEKMVIMSGKYAVFSNFLIFRSKLDELQDGLNILIDVSEAALIDHTFMDQMMLFKRNYERRGGIVEIEGLEKMRGVSNHPLATHKSIKS
jgi:MFS superfamily sulfate permease-like transporter